MISCPVTANEVIVYVLQLNDVMDDINVCKKLIYSH